MAGADIRLWCILIDHDFGDILGNVFSVDMSSEGAVDDLKMKIMAKKGPSLAHIPPDELVVWKCPGLNVRGDDENDDELAARIHGLNFSKKEEAQRLSETRRVSSLGVPPDEMLLVQLPGGREYKRRHDEVAETDFLRAVKRLKTEAGKAAPSNLAEPHEFSRIAGRDHIIACNRPFEYKTLPLALLHKAFGIFTDRCKAAPSERALEFLDKLALTACVWYQEETQRRSAVQSVFQKHLGIRFDSGKIFNTEYTTDGHLVVNIMPAAIRQCQNNSGNALSQAILYYSHFLLNAVTPNFKTTFPCILMVDMGSSFGFYGAAWDGERVRAEPLAPVFDLATHWRQRSARHAIASCFDAFVVAIEHIQAHYNSIAADPVPTPLTPQYLARLHEARKYPFFTSYDDDGQETRFTYDERLDEDKLIFSATVDQPGSGECIVKFAWRYSETAHNHLAFRGLAPRLWRCVQISEDWTAVVMDKSTYEVLFGLQLSPDEQKKVKSKVRRIVQTLHEGGFVHGDVRNTNLLIDRASLASDDVTVHLIDFDSAGRVGEARYPMEINWKTVRRPEGVRGGELITALHDDEMVSYMFEN